MDRQIDMIEIGRQREREMIDLMDEWMMDKQTYDRDRQVDRWMDGWMMDKYVIDGWIQRQIDDTFDRRTDSQIEKYTG